MNILKDRYLNIEMLFYKHLCTYSDSKVRGLRAVIVRIFATIFRRMFVWPILLRILRTGQKKIGISVAEIRAVTEYETVTGAIHGE